MASPNANHPLLSILNSWGVAYLALGAALYFLCTPNGYDKINSARQILKFRDIDSYIAAKKDYAANIAKLGELCRQNNISAQDANTILNLIRISPFYDANKHKVALYEAWKQIVSDSPFQTMNIKEKMKALYAQLHDDSINL